MLAKPTYRKWFLNYRGDIFTKHFAVDTRTLPYEVIIFITVLSGGSLTLPLSDGEASDGTNKCFSVRECCSIVVLWQGNPIFTNSF